MKIIESPTITEPGLYRMSAAAYHAGPTPAPELSSSIAKIIVQQSPLHAYTVHPKLGAKRDEDDESDDAKRTEMMLGSAIHKIALGHGAEITWVNPADHVGKRGGIPKGWTNDSIRDRRDEIVALGGIPLLSKYQSGVNRCAGNLRLAVEDWMCCDIKECFTEAVICWEEQGFWRKAQIDIARHDLLRLGDLKSTRMSIAPEACSRHIDSESMEIQAAFYLRACDAIDTTNAGRREFAFFFGEQTAPYQASRPIVMTEPGLEIGRMQVGNACRIWDECLENNVWPGYGNDPYYAEPAAWKLKMLGNAL